MYKMYVYGGRWEVYIGRGERREEGVGIHCGAEGEGAF
jgi:hypothetical protein